MPKTISLKDAQDQLTAATAAVDQIKAKILDQGPGSVTAEELGQAALDVEHAKLTLDHAAKQAEELAAAERLDNLQLLKQQILRDAGDTDAALNAMRRIEDGVAALIDVGAGRQQLIAQSAAAMRRAGVPRNTDGQADQHAGLAWSDATAFGSDAVHVDGRRIGNVNAGLLIAAAISRGCRTAGRSTAWLGGTVQVNGDPAVDNDPETWLRKHF